MSALRVRPPPLKDRDRVKRIREIFRLDRPPFAAVPDGALILAFTPVRDEHCPTFQRAYGTCDSQTLEFYGDTVIYMILSMVMLETFGLGNTPEFLTQLKNHLASNRMLTDWMLALGACGLVGKQPYAIEARGPKFHNRCADAFEALVGALYFHLASEAEGGLCPQDALLALKKWLTGLVDLPNYLQAFMDRMGGDVYNVYTAADRDAMLARLNAKKGERLRGVEALARSGEFSAEEVAAMRADVEEHFTAGVEDFARGGTLLVYQDEGLASIFDRLGWGAPEYVREEAAGAAPYLLLYGYPNGRRRIIGVGADADEADREAFEYLVNTGHIVVSKPPAAIYAQL